MTTLLAAACLWQLGPLHYDANQRQLSNADKQLYLEPRQHQLLLCLLQDAGQVVSRDTLIAKVWQGRIVSDSAINRAVSMLRKALASLDQHTDYIETMPKLGYRLLVAANTRAGTDAAVPHAAAAAPVARRHRFYAVLLLPLLTAIAVIAWWFITKEVPHVKAGHVAPQSSFNGVESQLSINNAATVLLYQRQADNGHQQIWLHRLTDNNHRVLTPAEQESRNAAISPDGSQFAYVRLAAGGCQLMLQPILPQPTTEQQTTSRLLHHCPTDNTPLLSWHPDGKTLYFRQRTDKTQPYQIYQLHIASAAVRQLTLPPANYAGLGDIAVAASAQQLALLRYTTADRSELLLLDPNSGSIIQTQPLPLRATALTWYNQQILLLSAGQMLYQYHLPTAKLTPLYQAADPVTSFVVASNDTLYFTTAGLSADIWHIAPGAGAEARINSSRPDTMPRLSHDATQLAFLSTRQGHEQLWLQLADGTEQLLSELPGQPGFIRPEWSADDNHLLFSKDGAAYSVDISNAKLQTLLTADKQVGIANWGPDNNTVLYSSQRDGDWQLWLYNTANNTEQKLTTHGGYSGRIWQGKLYFSKYHQDGLWYKDLPSGNEQLLLAQFDKINWLNWHIDRNNLYYYVPGQGIYRFNLVNGDNTLHLAEPGRFVRHFSVRHGKTVFVRYRELQGDIYRLPLIQSH
ncbi:PD40 domain-containing protein [Rheinheimera sp. YQF-2]|uniref:PD40 domain-containing protein n=1 Tax=Rheinheimera lutimaris TaxID=2740584 RepID=A0A7Y5APJ6_9GAMM|nr:winged helix-turn-helix domain-containing protein [Rheinheimera lutimaris]NRQ41754.1 PD40 domain-containing protein [Rheinheimera lutimaris]